MNSSEIVIAQNDDQYCDSVPITARNCMLLVLGSEDCAYYKIDDCLPFVNATSCGSDNLFQLSLMITMISENREQRVLQRIIENFEFILNCYLPDASQEGLILKFTDGSTVSNVAMNDCFRLADHLLDAINDDQCNLYFRVEAILSQLALLQILYNLPGESISTSTSSTTIYSTVNFL